jgi:hypothetical protein
LHFTSLKMATWLAETCRRSFICIINFNIPAGMCRHYLIDSIYIYECLVLYCPVSDHFMLPKQVLYNGNLTNSMEQSPSQNACGPFASQEISRILWNSKFHYSFQYCLIHPHVSSQFPVRSVPGIRYITNRLHLNWSHFYVFLICIYIVSSVLWNVTLIRVSRYSNSLRTGRSGDRIPAVARFSAPVLTGPGAHPASYKWAPRFFFGGNAAGPWRWPPTASI